MIQIDSSIINDERMIAGMSSSERFAALALEKMRSYNLRDKVNAFFTDKRKIIVMNTTKNEETYLLEWIAYHRLIGVDGIVLLDNDSVDSTPAILSALYRAGIVCGVPWPTVHPFEKMQISAFANAISALQAADAAEWLGFLDLDEFYVSREFGNIDGVLENLPPADAYHLTWQFYGSGGAEKREDGLVIERFQQRAAFNHGKNWQGKPLMRLQSVTGHFHHPHTVKLAKGSSFKFPNGADFPGVLPQRNAPNGRELFMEKIRSAHKLGVHHYAVRSREEFLIKARAGRVNYRETEDKKVMADQEIYFKGLDINDEHDAVIADMADDVRAEMVRIVEEAKLEHILPEAVARTLEKPRAG